MCWARRGGVPVRFSSPKGHCSCLGLYPSGVVDFRLYNDSDVTCGSSVGALGAPEVVHGGFYPCGRLVVNIQYWKSLVGLSRAGTPKEVCLIAWQQGGPTCG